MEEEGARRERSRLVQLGADALSELSDPKDGIYKTAAIVVDALMRDAEERRQTAKVACGA